MFIVDRDHRLIRANRAACESLGVHVGDVLGQICYRVVHGSDEPPEGCPHAELLRDERPHEADMDEPKLGGRIHVSCSPLSDEQGRVVASAHVFRPKDGGRSEGRRGHAEAEEEGAEPDAHPLSLRVPGPGIPRASLDAGPLLDAMPEHFAALDREYRVLWVNEAAAAEAGRSTDDLIGRRCHEALYRSQTPCARCAVAVAFHTGRPAEVERRTEDGRYLLHRAYPVRDGEREIVAAVAFTQDVTARRRAEIAMAESATRTRAALQASVRAMGAVIELRDPDTARHQRNVARLARALAVEMELPEGVAESLWYAGQLLDIGKQAVPIDILGRPGPLSESERMLVRVHPQAAEQVLKDIPFDRPVTEAIAQHHERLDGSGYPAGLRGGQIALEARILAVADVVTAMLTNRPHRPALELEAVMTEVRRGTGTQFDVEAVAALERLADRDEMPAVE